MAKAPRGLHGQLIHEVGLRIATGELAVGEQLLPDELGERYGVSRTVVREMLRVLESKGMIQARPKTGTRVLGVEQWDLLDRDVIRWRVRGPDQARQLDELMELRSAIEPMAARDCASSADAEIGAQLATCCDQMEQAVRAGDHAAFTDADIAFHAALLTGSGNRIFGQVSEAIEAVLRAREELALLPEHIE
ncbi:MAG: FadR/GntR family transcriptional regulator, partial [Micromonosporaceae bacterium]